MFFHLLEHVKMDIGGTKTDILSLIIFPLLQKLMDACDPHQGGDVSALDRINGGSNTKQIASNSKKKGDY